VLVIIAILVCVGAAPLVYRMSREPLPEEPGAPSGPRERTELEKYLDLELMASRERAREYAATVRPAGEKPLFDPFSVDTDELGAMASKMRFSERRVGATGKASLPKAVAAPGDLDAGGYPLKLYDAALQWTREQLIERQILDSFVAKWNLAPPVAAFSTEVKWDKSGLSLEASSGRGSFTSKYAGMSRESLTEAALADMLQQAVRFQRERIAVASLQKRLDEFATAEEKAKYFPGGQVKSISQVVEFLKSRATIDRQVPELVRQEEAEAKQQHALVAQEDLELRLLEAYFKKRSLLLPAEKVKVETRWQPRGLEVIVSGEYPAAKPFRQFIPEAPDPKVAGPAERK
jgi:hypothetical protein